MKDRLMSVSVNAHNPKVVGRNLLDNGAISVRLGNSKLNYDGITLYFDDIKALREFALELKTEAIIAEAIEQDKELN